ncbi:hypothetical protein [Alkalihalobacillus sp. CinArs1]|uniref:hypothetical protein n=1 Tax=Alkalihalobacillus sp. CinArs1 TaxID=2995314 RepID=UPI0022DE43F1|nr:hypothetical protein [Alkalihalobacillus sp. CinArs1]
MSERKDKPANSSMAMDEKEMKELGKEMEELETNQELKKNGRRPDPVQNEKGKKE